MSFAHQGLWVMGYLLQTYEIWCANPAYQPSGLKMAWDFNGHGF